MSEEIFIPPVNLTETMGAANFEANTNARRRTFHHYYIQPFSTAHHNGCAQAAMATLLTYWNKLPYDVNLAETLYQNPKCSPNVVAGLFGTNLERFQEAMVLHGLKAQIINEPRNTVFIDVEAKYAQLQKWVIQGHPVPVIVGNGELNAGGGFHWAIVTGAGPADVDLGNYGQGFYTVSKDKFLRAWSSWLLPGIHYGAILI